MSTPERITAQQINREVSREVTRIKRDHAGTPMSRCRVCTDPEAKRRVNTLLSAMMGPTEIVATLADLNEGKRKNQKIGFWSVRDHRENHFNIQEPARAAVRRTMEARAAEEGALLGEGVRNILTARGYLEIMAQKGFEHLVDDRTTVPFDVGVEAQLKLEALVKASDGDAEQAAIRRDVALIQQAVVETLTPEQLKAVSHRLAVLRGDISEDADDTIDAEVDEDYDEDDEESYVADIVDDEGD